MWPRLSLQAQLIAILLFVLCGEGALGSLWMLRLLPHELHARALETGRLTLRLLGEELARECAPSVMAGCARPRIEKAVKAGDFERVEIEGYGQQARAGVDSSRESAWWVSAEPLPGVTLRACVSPTAARADGARLLELYLSNLLLAIVALAVLGAIALHRAVAQPVERLANIADRIGHLDLGGNQVAVEGPMLGQLGTAFERMARALNDEKQRTEDQISELTRMNRDLKEARDSLIRQEQLATVGRLAAGVAHEVGNPLGGILGYAELLKGREDPQAKEYAQRIEVEVARIDKTVRGLLEYARPSDNALAGLSLTPCLQAALALCRADKRFKEVQVSEQLPEAIPPVLADEHRLSQVLVNLLLNAGDAMGGRGLVELGAEVVESPSPRRRASDPPAGRVVRLHIDDSGPGIAPGILPRIFDPFFTTKEIGQGTGLGLSICASIMSGFGGEIVAENRERGGARFTITLRVPGPAASLPDAPG